MNDPRKTEDGPAMALALESVVLRLENLERRIAALEPQGGFVCAGCGQRQPRNYYVYTARNSETGKTITPLCAPCVRGGLSEVMGKPWKHLGPFPQNTAGHTPEERSSGGCV